MSDNGRGRLRGCDAVWDDAIDIAVGASEVEPTARQRASLSEHMAMCAVCAAAFTARGELVARLEGRGDGVPDQVRAGAWAGVLAALAASGDLPAHQEATPAAASERRPLGRRAWGWGTRSEAAFAVAALAAAAAVFALTEPRPLLVDDGFTARGGVRGRGGVTAFCIQVDPRQGQAQVTSASSPSQGQAARCHAGDRLQFTYTWLPPADAPPAHLTLFGLGPNGETAWYFPRDGVALEAHPGARQAPITGSFDVAVAHAPGRWRVVGYFGEPLSRYDAEMLMTSPQGGTRAGTVVETAFVLEAAR
jgi:hypothetical protein